MFRWGKLFRLSFVMALTTSGAVGGQSDYRIDVWTVENGMPNSSVTSLAQTPDGYLWVGTFNGLARFDGVRFTNFDPLNSPELKHPRVLGLLVDAGGTLWINTYDGSLTSWRDGKFVHEWRGWDGMEMIRTFVRSNDLVFAATSGVLISRVASSGSPANWTMFGVSGRTTGLAYRRDQAGVLWYFTREGQVGRVVGTNSQILPPECGLADRRVSCLDVDRSGNIWVGTDKGIARWDGQRFQNRTPTNGEPEVNVSFLLFTKDGACWAVADNQARKFKDQQWVEEAEEWGRSFGAYVPALIASEDRHGGTWFCHYGQGVFHPKADGTFHRLTTAEGLPGDRVSCWLQDNEGNVWLGVDRGGLVRLREKRIQVIGPEEGLTASGAMTLCEDRAGALWIGTYGGGLNCWRDGKLSSFNLPEGPTKGFIFSAYPDAENRLWLSAGREDLFYFKEGQIKPASSNVHGIKVTLVDREGRLWLGKNRGLSRLTGDVLESFGPTSGFDHTLGVHALAEDALGNIWVGANNGVLYRFRDDKFTAYQANDKRGGYAIWSLLPDADDSVWVGSFRGGLSRFRDGQFTRCTTEHGLPSDVVCQILDDDAGSLWVGSHRGIFQIKKSDFAAFARGELNSMPTVAYGIHDGLPALECSGGYQPSAWHGRDGRLWFATRKGVVSIRPDETHNPRPPPPVVIEEVRVDGATVAMNPGSLGSNAPPLRIAPGKHYFEFRYTALSYAAPDQVRFRCKIERLEDNWIERGANREMHFSHLSPGEYKFRVTACNNDGVWNEAGAVLAFEVLPHFYETVWFRALAGLLAAAIVAGIMRHLGIRRMRQEMEKLARQQAVERDRARIARDIHDDLGSGLTRIMLQSELANCNLPPEAEAHLGQITDTARGLTRALDEIVWAVDPEEDTLSGLMNYVTPFVEDFLRVAGIRCRIDMPDIIPPVHVDAEARYNLFLALKESLNNIVKHAQASEVWLRLRLEEEGFTLVVEDNGRGLVEVGSDGKSPRFSSGHGLSNLEKRLQVVGGKCVVESGEGRGTRVEMTICTPSSRSVKKAMGGDGQNPLQ